MKVSWTLAVAHCHESAVLIGVSRGGQKVMNVPWSFAEMLSSSVEVYGADMKVSWVCHESVMKYHGSIMKKVLHMDGAA